MEMTIDKTIEFFDELECHTPQAKDARDVAIETMRKYQKIEQIISEWTTNMNVNTTMAMCEIEEVVEDGKIDEGEQP